MEGNGDGRVAPSPENPYVIEWTEFFSMIQDKDLALYHKYGGLEGIARHLQSSLTEGLPSSSVQNRGAVFGVNYLPPEEEVTYMKFLKEALSDKMMLLLLVLGAVALVIGLTVGEGGHGVDYSKGWIDGTFIILAVFLVVLATTINDYLKELKFQSLNAKTNAVPFHVYRDGQRVTIDVSEIVVGDIVEFTSGTHVPVDGLFISGQGVTIDESACTGENDEKKKKVSLSAADTIKEKDPFIISGTSVIAAEEGRLLCIGVGENSFSGKLEMQTRTGKLPTPLQEKLDDLADTVGRVGIATAIVLFLTLTIISAAKNKSDWDGDNWRSLLDYAIVGVSIVVVAVPEGLPLSVTIALAYSMSAMLKDNNMVRSLAACETMGAATQICSDKTGTLTTNNMTMVKGYVGGHPLKPFDHNGATPLKLTDVSDVSQQAMDVFLEAAAFNSSASQIKKAAADEGEGDEDAGEDGLVWVGNKTEQGILRFAKRAAHHKGGIQGIRDRLARKEDRFIFPFQSARKSMTTIVKEDKHPVHGPSVMQYTKGASETILEYSSHYLDSAGAVQTMHDDKRAEFADAVNHFAKEGFRVIGVAFRKYGDVDEPFPEKDPFEPSPNLCLAGFCAIQDPVRDEVPRAVALCKGAGVCVRMCTGDNIETARAIAKQCGIIGPLEADAAMIGPDFRKLFCDDQEGRVAPGTFQTRLRDLRVLARCSPLDKQLLVGNLMLLGEVVAVTGDGTNDAPALKLADVGFAMNIGTDVAKKASKIVLLDNNFVSVVKACRWGRNVNDNIRKFLQFQFTVNVVLLIVTFVGATVDAAKTDGNGDPPLAAVHLLWCNLIMDTMAALALSTENPHDSLMRRLPTYRSAPLISRRMWRFVFGSAVYQLTVTMILIFLGEDLFDTHGSLPALPNGSLPYTPEQKDDHDKTNDRRLRTVIFNVFIYMQVFNWFHARKLYDEINFLEGFDRSPLFIPIVLFTAAFQFFIVEVAQDFMETEPPGGARWGVALALAALMWPIGCVVRLIPIHEPVVVTKMLSQEAEHRPGEQESEEASQATTKLQMIQQVNKENLKLFGGRSEQRDVPFNVAQGMAASVGPEAVHGKPHVMRSFRGARGDTQAQGRKHASSITSSSNASASAAAARVGKSPPGGVVALTSSEGAAQPPNLALAGDKADGGPVPVGQQREEG
eukprot:TRINITY_DN3489_c0_g2_i1.p1 TRINITY_DN3489_c0_g2~~TRINITY_DN3489_c0_g2_i1.p1  ORF type:complete len:1177 (+),score=409.61 TRINITY_DN3489_c0_g2_i1:110-3640(+)